MSIFQQFKDVKSCHDAVSCVSNSYKLPLLNNVKVIELDGIKINNTILFSNFVNYFLFLVLCLYINVIVNLLCFSLFSKFSFYISCFLNFFFVF